MWDKFKQIPVLGDIVGAVVDAANALALLTATGLEIYVICLICTTMGIGLKYVIKKLLKMLFLIAKDAITQGQGKR